MIQDLQDSDNHHTMASSLPLISVIGSLHLDFVTTTARCPGPGETIQGSRFDVNAGGKGANQAAACGRAAAISEGKQDVAVQMIGAVGKDDPYYKKLWEMLQKSYVSTEYITEVAGTSTGTATIIVDEGAGGENRIVFVPGAGFEGMNDVKEIISRNPAKPNIVVLQGEIPRSTVLGLLEHYNSDNTTQVVFNPAPVWPDGIPAKSLHGLAALIVNETECLLLTKSMAAEGHDMPRVEKEEELSQAVLDDISSRFHDLLQVKTMIITLGSKGVFYSSGGQSGTIPAKKVSKVVDTTAAGDTFVGYFTTEMARASAAGSIDKFDVAKACKRANVASSICVGRAGAMQSIPFGFEVQ